MKATSYNPNAELTNSNYLDKIPKGPFLKTVTYLDFAVSLIELPIFHKKYK